MFRAQFQEWASLLLSELIIKMVLNKIYYNLWSLVLVVLLWTRPAPEGINNMESVNLS